MNVQKVNEFENDKMDRYLHNLEEQTKKELENNEKIHNLIRKYAEKHFIDQNDIQIVINDYLEGARDYYLSENNTFYITFEEWLEAMLENEEWKSLE